ncbi:MAG: hypothetical protein ACOH1J_01595 [Microbacteriaceae bacterium]
MHSAPLSFDPVQVIVGSWTMRATNLPIWLSGLTRAPRYEFVRETEGSLRIGETLSYATHAGSDVSVQSVNRTSGDKFVAHGPGLARLSTLRWTIAGASADEVVMAVKFDKTRLSPAGVNILVRQGNERPELRKEVASDIAQFGLSVEDFASLTWFNPELVVSSTQ